ncbi:hypothetical protein XF_0829 [Xylella fastidiosa 9a5c]|uniref:Uncharacterized protein n=1 Tax=Xylella fastidiosa (strain 9a5c) TaxID=160492 RepID=Q9PF49_XYLFA|nr:hypothetical protein XF_0829 [Xylella fastidiosa 9a5c]
MTPHRLGRRFVAELVEVFSLGISHGICCAMCFTRKISTVRVSLPLISPMCWAVHCCDAAPLAVCKRMSSVEMPML